MTDVSNTEEYAAVQARVPGLLYDRFLDICPQHGATTWFVRQAMENFVELAEQSPTMKEQVARAIGKFNQNS